MKKIFFMAVSAVLLAAGCQKTEIQNEVLPKIGFDTHMGKLTKAPDAGNTVQDGNLKEQGFMVWGHIVTTDLNYDAGELYLGINLGTDEESGLDVHFDLAKGWYTNDTYYWPGKNKELDIYAVSMFQTDLNKYGNVSRAYDLEEVEGVTQIDADPKTLTVANFVVEASADNDLMVAPMIRQDQDDAQNVNLKFQHALTKVLLTFSTTSEEDVYVVSAKTSPLISKGTLTVRNTDDDQDSQPKLYTANFDLSAWKTKDNDTFEYVAEYECTETVEDVVAGPTDDDGNTITTFKAHKLNGTPVTFGSWLLIPQEINDNTYLDVEYIVARTYMNQRFILYKDDVVEKWDVNQQTTYNVRITPDDIQFSPEVKDWTPDREQPRDN